MLYHSTRNKENIVQYLHCLEINTSTTGPKIIVIIEHTTTKVFDLSSNIISGNKTDNTIKEAIVNDNQTTSNRFIDFTKLLKFSFVIIVCLFIFFACVKFWAKLIFSILIMKY